MTTHGGGNGRERPTFRWTAWGRPTRRRAGPVTALQNINLDIRPREFVSVVGPSGCGKSTLLKLVAGLEDIYIGQGHGRRQAAGRSAGSARRRVSARRAAGLAHHPRQRAAVDRIHPQARAPTSGSARWRCSQRFGLGGFEHRFPWELSGGMRQRASICRALLADPELSADGRAVRRARRHDARRPQRRTRPDLAGHPQDPAVHHPLASSRRSSCPTGS